MKSIAPDGGAVCTRFAASPGGGLHVSSARTALLNWLFARHRGGRFILRIDDIDPRRQRGAFVRDILEALRWLGLDWDEGPEVSGPKPPYRQSRRTDLYADAVNRLKAAGQAYECFCEPVQEDDAFLQEHSVCDGRCRDLAEADRDRLRDEGCRPAVRLRMAPGAITFDDVIQGPVSVEAETMDDFVIARADGTPVSWFAGVVDDAAMGITHVIRPADHLPDTPKQIRLYEALGAPPPVFAHVGPVLARGSNKRLSRRHGAVTVQDFRDDGYLPDAMVDYLARMGLGSEDASEIFSLNELAARFDLSRVSPGGVSWDPGELRRVNGQHMRRLSPEERVAGTLPFLKGAGLVPESPDDETMDRVRLVVDILADRLTTFRDIIDEAALFFSDDCACDRASVVRWLSWERASAMLGRLKEVLAVQEPFTVEALEACVRDFARTEGLALGRVIHPLRAAVTGEREGPRIFRVLAALGRERCLARIDRALAMPAEPRQDS